jgi:hypothetical protein
MLVTFVFLNKFIIKIDSMIYLIILFIYIYLIKIESDFLKSEKDIKNRRE